MNLLERLNPDRAWLDPRGLRPSQEPGAPGLGRLAVAEIATWLALSSLTTLLAGLAGTSGTAAPVALAYGAGLAGLAAVLHGKADVLTRMLGDLIAYASVGAISLGAGLAIGGVDGLRASAGVALVVAGLSHRLHRRGWTCLAVVLSAVAGLLALLSTGDVPVGVYGAYLVVLGVFVIAGGRARVLRPTLEAYVLGTVVVLAGTQLLLLESETGAGLIAIAGIAAITALTLATQSPSLLPLQLIVTLVLAGEGLRGGALATVLAGSLAALTTAELGRRRRQPMRSGGVFLVCTLLVLGGAPALVEGSGALRPVIGVLALGCLGAAAASEHRRPALVLAGLEALALLPGRLVGGNLRNILIFAVAVAAVVLALRTREPQRPAAALVAQGALPPGQHLELTVPGAYTDVFRRTAALVGGLGEVELLDRAGGRIVGAGVTIALHADQPGTRLRVIGDAATLRTIHQRLTTAPEEALT